MPDGLIKKLTKEKSNLQNVENQNLDKTIFYNYFTWEDNIGSIN